MGLGGQRLGALERRRLGPEVDAVDVRGHVDGERAVADRVAQPGIGAGPPLWPGTWKRVEPRKA